MALEAMDVCSAEAVKYVWEGAIPIQIYLHESEVTTLTPPPPAIVLAPRIGYLPLLIPILKPHFNSVLPPGVDTIWFDYKGLPLKWYIPTGVLFDILCPEPERPWNLTVHFRAYPTEVLTPYEGEDTVKWSFINSLKEAAYIINGNCKNIMNMSQVDQLELWQSVLKGNMEAYRRISSRLKLGPVGEDCRLKRSSTLQARQSNSETNSTAPNQTGRIPVRLYIRYLREDADYLEEAVPIETWENISYINRPVEVHNSEGKYLTLQSAMEILLPDLFSNGTSFDNKSFRMKTELAEAVTSSEVSEPSSSEINAELEQLELTAHLQLPQSEKSKIKLVRIQGIEPGMDVPFSWIVNNLVNPEFYLHVCLFVCSDNEER